MLKRFVCVLAISCAFLACGGSATTEEVAPEASAMEEEAGEPMAQSYPDPEAEVATEVEHFVRGWVGERADDGVYSVPPRSGREVSGMMADFHTVHQKDEDTYSVCVDFQDGDNLYDVDFFVDHTTDGMALADHYLHKVNGEAIE